MNEFDIEIPFGRDSELIEESIAIPEGCYAFIEGNWIVIRKGKKPINEDLKDTAKKILRDKESAIKFLKEVGVMDENGNLAKEYRYNEPANEDLEEAVEAYANDIVIVEGCYTGKDVFNRIELAFEAGANWQKEQDQETIELAEEHALLAGRMQMKEEMMKNAVNTTLYFDYGNKTGFYGMVELHDIPMQDMEDGDKVKLIIIKED